MNHLESWKEEKRSAYLYTVISEVEKAPGCRRLFRQLGEQAESQALIWVEAARKEGIEIPTNFTPDLRSRVIAHLVRQFGVKPMRPILAAIKVRGMSVYSAPQALHHGHEMPTKLEQVTQEKRGGAVSSAGGNLRAAVFGANDGLVSNASLILGVSGGVAGAAGDSRLVLLSGAAGLLAGAFSMAAGEYISMRSQREMFEYQISLERDELKQYPKEEAAELALIYEARGLPSDEARRFADLLIANPEKALDTLAREELGLNPDELGSPLGAAVSSFLAFAMGAIIPLLPFLLLQGPNALYAAIAMTAVALFGIGAAISLFTGKNAGYGGLRMLFIGGIAGAATYLIGHWMGVSLG